MKTNNLIPKGFTLKRETKSARLQLLVTPTVADGLKTAAAMNGISTNEFCHRIFDVYLANRESEPIGRSILVEEAVLNDIFHKIETLPFANVCEYIGARLAELTQNENNN